MDWRDGITDMPFGTRSPLSIPLMPGPALEGGGVLPTPWLPVLKARDDDGILEEEDGVPVIAGLPCGAALAPVEGVNDCVVPDTLKMF